MIIDSFTEGYWCDFQENSYYIISSPQKLSEWAMLLFLPMLAACVYIMLIVFMIP